MMFMLKQQVNDLEAVSNHEYYSSYNRKGIRTWHEWQENVLPHEMDVEEVNQAPNHFMLVDFIHLA